MKIDLEIPREKRFGFCKRRIHLTRSLPWFKSPGGKLFHRVRSASIYLNDDGSLSHLSVRYLCCNQGGWSPRDDAGVQVLFSLAAGPGSICSFCEAAMKRKFKHH